MTPANDYPPFVQTIERNAHTRTVSLVEWPTDEPAQRAWCLARSIAFHGGVRIGGSATVDEVVDTAAAFLAWINGGES